MQKRWKFSGHFWNRVKKENVCTAYIAEKFQQYRRYVKQRQYDVKQKIVPELWAEAERSILPLMGDAESGLKLKHRDCSILSKSHVQKKVEYTSIFSIMM